LEENYKILLTNKNLYTEAELSSDTTRLRVGTGVDCDVRLRKELFFEPFEIEMFLKGEVWNIHCSENIYLSEGSARKLLARELRHGDTVLLKYNSSDNDLLTLGFSLDFDRSQKDYDREIDISQIDYVHIGGADHCDIFCRADILGDSFATVERRGADYYVIDNETRYGVYVNGGRITGEARLGDRDFFSIAGFSFYYKHRKLYCTAAPAVAVRGNLPVTDIMQSKSSFEYPMFNRSSRVKPVIPDAPLAILDPPEKPRKQSTNILLSLLPMLGMVVVVILMRGEMGGGGYIVMSVAMMGMGVVTSVISFISGKRKYKKDTKERIVQYKDYIEGKKKEIATYREEEHALLDLIYRDQSDNVRAALDFTADLFDRARADDDFLSVKVGEGPREALRAIDYKKKETFATDDELVTMPEEVSRSYKHIEEAPVTADLAAQNAVGVVGSWEALYDVLKNFTVDLSVRHYYSDVSLFYIIDEKYADIFSWLRYLPHVNNESMSMRNIAYDSDSRNAIYEYLYKELSSRESTKVHSPYYIIFVFDDEGFKRHPISKFIGCASELGSAFVFFDSDREQLPQHCGHIITVHGKGEANILRCDNMNDNTDFVFTPVDDDTATDVALKLSPVFCEDVSLEGSLTKNISLFELLGIFGVDDLDLSRRWAGSQVVKSMAAPLGVKSKDEVVYLDLHEKAHGPHGLVAGTTGSGKSEILQSYILSSATLFHPYDISFVIIDFKGGGMASQFTDLPHLVGVITNIDGKEINRSLLSIKAELLKRQSLFAASGVNKIDDYIKKYKNGEEHVPLPHLVIIVDEFAELKADQPEFMAELISAARIGRSLGVHLILATQKPSGQVSEQIWSNSRFKLCLKVQTPEDSNEMLKSPLAAEIREPGRAYFQVGNNEIFELFQSAYSGNSEKVEAGDSRLKSFYMAEVDLAGRRRVVYEQKKESLGEESRTQLQAIVSLVNEYCKANHVEKLPNICLPPLPEVLHFSEESEVTIDTQKYRIPLGLYDDPSNQYQGLAEIDIAAGNLMIIGSAQYGKTNLLQCVIRNVAMRYSPAEVNIYIIDFASMTLKAFEDLGHVGGVVTTSEDEKLKNLFKLLNEAIAVRKEKLVLAGVSSFAAYKEAGMTDMPLILLMVDNLTMLKELYLEDEDPLLWICREGISVGVSIMIANAQTSGIGYRYSSNFAHRIALYNNDSGEYSNLFDYCRMQPENLPGRSLVEIDKSIYECQTYLAFEGEKEIERVNHIRAFVDGRNATYAGHEARRIPEIPRVLTDEYLKEAFVIHDEPYKIHIGLDYETVEPVDFNFADLGLLSIVSYEGSVQYGFARRVITKLLEGGSQAPVSISIVDNYERIYEDLAAIDSVSYTMTHTDIIDIITEWYEELSVRYEKIVSGDHDFLRRLPLMLLLINSSDAIKELGENSDAMDKLGTIMSKYKSFKVAIMCTAIENSAISYSSPEALKLFKNESVFVYYGNLDGFKISDPAYSELKRFRKPIEKDDMYLMREDSVTKLKAVTSAV
jgi:S-DNA-T family DNA segregation ATPase FtsK/SpoIIIE